jgi:RHS repeat-associated protein
MNGTSTIVKAFGPLPAGATAVYNASGLQYYRHPDWLGSSRFASTSTRTMYNDLAFAPFGEPYAQVGSTGVTDVSFAGNNEDTTTNLYDAYFREYGIQGRWSSPDPAGTSAVNPSNPQTWNRYAYVENLPENFTDPSGMYRAMPYVPAPLPYDPFAYIDVPVFVGYAWEDLGYIPHTDQDAYGLVPVFLSGIGLFGPQDPQSPQNPTPQPNPNNQQLKPNPQPQPNPQPPAPSRTAKQNFCFYTNWLAGGSTGLGLATRSMGGGSGITELGLETTVGSLAETSALAAAGPYLLVGGLALWGVRTVVCMQ